MRIVRVLLATCLLATSLLAAEGNPRNQAIVNVPQPEGGSSNVEESADVVPTKVFKPEKYWKNVEADEAIPKGLHVRINLSTGQKEAKLLEAEDKDEDTRDAMTPEQLKTFLKGVKDESSKLKETDRSKFRDMETIEKDFASLNLRPVKSDSHTIQELLELYRNKSSKDEEKEGHLREMEYLLHQYDVAKDFVRMGGIKDILPGLNNTILRDHVALALGAALQGNPSVQKAMLDSQGLHALLVSSKAGCGSQCIFALSTLVRQFPAAQKLLIDLGGLQVLAQVFQSRDSNLKLRLKIVTLLSDLLVERNHALTGAESSDRKKQYIKIDITPSIVSSGFCELIPTLMKSSSEDTREKVLHALHGLVGFCNFDRLVPQLESLKSHYKFRMFEDNVDTADEYFSSLFLLSDDLIKHITDKGHSHAEL